MKYGNAQGVMRLGPAAFSRPELLGT
jgi:hypothetical protein